MEQVATGTLKDINTENLRMLPWREIFLSE